MTPFAEGALLRAARGAPAVDVDALAAGGVLVFAPHPDDETLGCGAALAGAVAAGHAVRVVAATDGGGSHLGSIRWSPERTGAHRARELAAALDVLGSGRIRHERLGCRDRGVPCTDASAGRCVIERLVARVLEERPAYLWTTWEGDPHVDHRRCAALARAVVREAGEGGHAPMLIRFPVWGRFVEIAPVGSNGDALHDSEGEHAATSAIDPDEELVRFSPDSTLKGLKRRALACHATQMTTLIDDDPDGFVMPAAMQTHFVEHDELFLRPRAA